MMIAFFLISLILLRRVTEGKISRFEHLVEFGESIRLADSGNEKSLVLFFCSIACYEIDYAKELFPLKSFEYLYILDHMTDYNMLRVQQNVSLVKQPKVVIYNYKSIGAHEAIIKYRPRVIVHLSDEHQRENNQYGLGYSIYNHAPLVLKQYGVSDRSIKNPRSNVIQIPLACMNGMINIMFESSDSLAIYSANRKTSHRYYTWSFIGSLRNKERKDAVVALSSLKPHVLSDGDAIYTPLQMRNIYNDSRFVFVGRGQISFDCLRIYEAIVCGAVPIVIIPTEKIQRQFNYDGDTPPLLFATSPTQAVNIIQTMNESQIDNARDRLAQWYHRRWSMIRRRIHDVMTTDQ